MCTILDSFYSCNHLNLGRAVVDFFHKSVFQVKTLITEKRTLCFLLNVKKTPFFSFMVFLYLFEFHRLMKQSKKVYN